MTRVSQANTPALFMVYSSVYKSQDNRHRDVISTVTRRPSDVVVAYQRSVRHVTGNICHDGRPAVGATSHTRVLQTERSRPRRLHDVPPRPTVDMRYGVSTCAIK